MGRKEKRAYREAIRQRYRKANRETKKRILDEFCQVCRYNRKYAIRLLNGPQKRTKTKRGRKSVYGDPSVLRVLNRIWRDSDFMCSRRLKVVIPMWLPHYQKAYEPVPEAVVLLLMNISPATIDRVLRPMRLRRGRGLCGTKPGGILRSQIPIRTSNWDITKPGFVEADTVAHCGNSLAGDFVWTLTMTDIHTAWTESRAVWNKGSGDVVERIRDIEHCLPFELLGFDCDNGSEFLTHHLWRYFAEREAPVQFTRSRPYKKNDNAHVEQKNWAHARHLLGYDRIDDPNLTSRINSLYANEWSLYQNHFCPSLKLKQKHRVRSKYKKTYHTPQTPYQRVMKSPHVTQQTKTQLKATHDKLNPFTLKRQIERKLKTIFKNLRVTSNVRQRL